MATWKAKNKAETLRIGRVRGISMDTAYPEISIEFESDQYPLREMSISISLEYDVVQFNSSADIDFLFQGRVKAISALGEKIRIAIENERKYHSNKPISVIVSEVTGAETELVLVVNSKEASCKKSREERLAS